MCLLGAAVSSLQLADPWDEAWAYRGLSSHLIYYILLFGSLALSPLSHSLSLFLSLSLSLSLDGRTVRLPGRCGGFAVQCM